MHSRKKLLAAALTTTVGIIGFAAPAHANTSQGFVAGSGAVTDDFGDEGTVSKSSHTRSGATGLWQYILWADGAKESDGSTFDASDIDCDFGPNTEYATKDWQRRYGLGADGVVGTGTFGRADNKLAQVGDLGEGQIRVRYNGSVHTFDMIRNGYNSGLNSYGYFSAGSYAFYRYSSAPGDCV
ncbi:peptidoglycan-binding domain-containing protein [Micromonospora robiginosa]|uniref:Peptidoglycan-binding domain-containing protein n=1 Tax=Micromonospora robiginosa TaxID=2749844 RepID=A0A7L6BDB4_9ACTN|nr:peptidoglycan-binding protein [Micromonospora ferruginea]QLQ39942.1 peptidoglycan-binding domain-containing protein [Micromonospora ferruginea]